MILGGWPLAGVPLAAYLIAATEPKLEVFTPADLPKQDLVWMARLAAASNVIGGPAAPPGMLAGLPFATAESPPDLPSFNPEILVSDRGWIGEPDDSSIPNVPYPPRMAQVPAIEAVIPIIPGSGLRRTLNIGEIVLDNADGRYDNLAGNWRLGGKPVEIWVGPHERPIHAAFSKFSMIAKLRASGAATGTLQLKIPLRDRSADLEVAACNLYGGTGGADGDSNLAGKPKPRLFGIRRMVEPVLEDPTRLIYRINDGAISSVLAVRDRGAAYTFASNVASYAALQAAIPSAGTYITCLAAGCIRVEPAGAAGIKLLTVDARGDVSNGGYGSGSAADIANKLLFSVLNFNYDDVSPSAFSSWPVGEVGLYIQGGTVAEALDRLASGVGGWWGIDRLGRVNGSQIEDPSTVAPAWTIQPWMLLAPPEEDASLLSRPRWRTRVGYRPNGIILSGENIVDSATAADRALWSQPYQTTTTVGAGVLAAYPQAEDAAILESLFDSQSDAQSLCDKQQAIHGTPRRSWRVGLNRAGLALETGAAVRLVWNRYGFTDGKTLLVRGFSLRGERVEATLWG